MINRVKEALKRAPRQVLITSAMMVVTGILITVTGILFHQAFLRMLPLYISLVVSLLNSRVNRFGPLLGGINSLLYALVYWHYGLYASAVYAVAVSCPFQLATFINWRRHAYKQSVVLKRMTGKQRAILAAGCAVVWLAIYAALRAAGSSYALLDNTTTILGTLTTILCMLAYIEYTVLTPINCLISTALYIAMLRTTPEQVTYLIYNIYCTICCVMAFFRARSLYAEQRGGNT